jgi:hypothetical protein
MSAKTSRPSTFLEHALAAARAGELLARGWRALSPSDPGYAAAKAANLTSIPAEVALTTQLPEGERGGLYHCIVRYVVDGTVWFDDPSARLGMLPERLDGQECHERIVTRVVTLEQLPQAFATYLDASHTGRTLVRVNTEAL